jgi:RNA polymerase sigma-70 factor (ECF subfamily)
MGIFGTTTQPREQSWRECYRAHAPKLLLYARQWLPCRADAEDAVQSGFVKFWRHKPVPLEPDIPLLYTAVRSAALDLIKRNQRRQIREDVVAVETGDVWWDADSLEERDRAEKLQAALDRLEPQQREVVVLRMWADLTFADIARTTGESINTITSRYRYALANLKKLMPEESHERS